MDDTVHFFARMTSEDVDSLIEVLSCPTTIVVEGAEAYELDVSDENTVFVWEFNEPRPCSHWDRQIFMYTGDTTFEFCGTCRACLDASISHLNMIEHLEERTLSLALLSQVIESLESSSRLSASVKELVSMARSQVEDFLTDTYLNPRGLLLALRRVETKLSSEQTLPLYRDLFALSWTNTPLANQSDLDLEREEEEIQGWFLKWYISLPQWIRQEEPLYQSLREPSHLIESAVQWNDRLRRDETLRSINSDQSTIEEFIVVDMWELDDWKSSETCADLRKRLRLSRGEKSEITKILQQLVEQSEENEYFRVAYALFLSIDGGIDSSQECLNDHPSEFVHPFVELLKGALFLTEQKVDAALEALYYVAEKGCKDVSPILSLAVDEKARETFRMNKVDEQSEKSSSNPFFKIGIVTELLETFFEERSANEQLLWSRCVILLTFASMWSLGRLNDIINLASKSEESESIGPHLLDVARNVQQIAQEREIPDVFPFQPD